MLQQHSIVQSSPPQKRFFRFSLLAGMTRVFDFGQRLHTYRLSISRPNSDYAAIASDWESLGFDMHVAIEKFGSEYHHGVQIDVEKVRNNCPAPPQPLASSPSFQVQYQRSPATDAERSGSASGRSPEGGHHEPGISRCRPDPVLIRLSQARRNISLLVVVVCKFYQLC